MSRFVRQPESPKPPAPRRSVYEDRPAPERPWVQIADTNPLTGQLEWDPDWGRLANGWWPLDEFLHRR